MDKQEVEKCPPVEDGNHLNRNRSFKTKQLVRSQAIRESASPPRTVSPSVQDKSVNKVNVNVTERTESGFHDSEYGYSDRKERRKPVEIQITQGSWDENPTYEHRGRAKRWLSDSSRDSARDSARDLLSNNPRVACVCGACAACPQCRGRRRRHICTIKQDSGICADECSECDAEPNGINHDGKKTGSVEVDDQCYCRCPERRDRPKSTLSRTDSDDKLEPTGPELVAFIKETLNKSGKDRVTLLRIEKELYSLVNDTGRCIVKFPVMTSYGRMLVHRCASLFQLSHQLDQSNKNCVVVSKSGTSGGRIPCTNFKTWCIMNFPPPSPQRHSEAIDGANAKSILKRDGHSLDSPAAGALAMNRSKSLEQREREYERVRRRIFSTDNCNQEESQWPWLTAGTVKLLAPEPGRNKLLKVQSLEGAGGRARGGGGAVAKSHSFGGYGEPPTRALSRQGDLASSSWRLSPSSSGYKTLSLRSTDSVTPSPTGGGTPEPSCTPAAPCTGPVVWAVTDMACVPAGAIVLHPQTGTALTNPDGSLYHFDPANPPIMYDPTDYEETEQPKVDQNNEKRRGRLEKQHSFIDHEECQQVEQYQYEYDIHAQENTTGKEIPKPATPTKRYEPIQSEYKPEPTNQTEAPAEPANQRAYDPANRDVREIKAGSYQDTVYYGPFASLNRGYNEEVQSPPQMSQYIQPDMTLPMMPPTKVTPILQDPNIRPMSLTNVVYPPSVPPGYQYVPTPAQCRVEPLQQQLVRYQPLLSQLEEQKVPTPPQPDNTFRIDSSYPYAPVDYTSAYGGCVDNTLQNQTQPQRSYSVPYNPAELAAGVPPVYPLHGVAPPIIQYPMQYTDAGQWAAVQNQPMYPVVYQQQYAHYNIVYPQVMPQPYPMCQPIYPVLETHRKRNSLPSSVQVTPIITEEKPYEKFDRQNSDIAAKINQIKEGMIQRESMMQREGILQREGMNRRRDDWKRNSGNGILGSYPVNNFNGRISGATDNIQMTAARAIVNSIRHLQGKNTYQERRDHNYQRNYDRPDRRRHDYRTDINGKGDSNANKDCQEKCNAQDRNTNKYQDRKNEINCNTINSESNNSDIPNHENNLNYERNNQTNAYKYQGRTDEDCDVHKNKAKTPEIQEIKLNQEINTDSNDVLSNADKIQSNVTDRTSNVTDRTINVTDRTSYVTDRGNVPDRSISNVTDRTSNVTDRTSYVTDRGNVPDRSISNVTDRTSNVTDRTSYVTDRGNVPDRSISNVTDRTSNVTDRTSYVTDRGNVPDRSISNVTDRTSNVTDRTSYVTDRGNVPDRSISNVTDRTSNVTDRMIINAADRGNVPDRSISNVTDRTSNVTDRMIINAADRGNVPDRSISNVTDRTSNVIDRSISNVTDRTIGNVTDRSINNVSDRRNNVTDRTISNVNDRTSNVNDRTSNVTDRTSNVTDRTSNITDRAISYITERSISNVSDRSMSNVTDRTISNVNDSTSNVNDRTSNVTDRTSNITDRAISYVTERSISNVSDRSMSNVTDRTIGNVTDRTQSNAQDRSVHNYHDRTQDRNSYQEGSYGQDVRNQDIRNYQDRNYQDRNYQDRNYQDRNYQDRNYQDRNYHERKFAARGQGMNPGPYQYRPPFIFRQMAPAAAWCRRSPAPVHPGVNQPRRPNPDNRNGRRY